jgi:hypothetical protein
MKQPPTVRHPQFSREDLYLKRLGWHNGPEAIPYALFAYEPQADRRYVLEARTIDLGKLTADSTGRVFGADRVILLDQSTVDRIVRVEPNSPDALEGFDFVLVEGSE